MVGQQCGVSMTVQGALGICHMVTWDWKVHGIEAYMTACG